MKNLLNIYVFKNTLYTLLYTFNHIHLIKSLELIFFRILKYCLLKIINEYGEKNTNDKCTNKSAFFSFKKRYFIKNKKNISFVLENKNNLITVRF